MKTVKKPVRLSVDWAEDTWAPKIAYARFAMPVPRLSPLPLSVVNHRCYSPSQSSLFTSRGSRGFTLVEMLVVIGIIAILAGILLPTLSGVKRKAKIAEARTVMGNLISAITAYESEYSRPPAAPDVENLINNDRPDFTYGTHEPGMWPTMLLGDLPSIRNGYSYEADNRIVMNVIMDRTNGYPNINHARNPRKIINFRPKLARTRGEPGMDDQGVFRDPFGHPYIITIDMNEDNMCRDAYYSPNNDSQIPGPVVVWSLGPDGQVTLPRPNTPEHTGANKDNILSWR